MPALILDGTVAAKVLLDSLRKDAEEFSPHLVIVQVGKDSASDSYIRKKMEQAQELGIRCMLNALEESTTPEEMLSLVHAMNEDPTITGYIIQLPLPPQLSARQPQIFREIDPAKDVDGFTAYNLGKMFLSTEFEHLPPATPAGIIALLRHYDIDVSGKTAVIVGQSNIVGKPLSVMLKNRGVTTINCDVHTNPAELKDLCKRYGEILICAVGKPALIKGSMIKPGAVVVDVGMNWTDDGLVGDVVYDEAVKVASAITPVPGGVGPMTVASLLRNCITAARRQRDARAL